MACDLRTLTAMTFDATWSELLGETPVCVGEADGDA